MHPPDLRLGRGVSAPFEARYYGTCADCGQKIEPGDEITVDRDPGTVRNTWRHVACPAGHEAPLEHRAPVCDECWLEKPCACEEER